MKKSIILTIALNILGLTLLSQTKTQAGYISEIICVDFCDITLKKTMTDEAPEYFRITYEADGKTMKMNQEGKTFFIERENDIVLKPEYKEKQFNIAYTVKGEDKIVSTINLVGQSNNGTPNATTSTMSKADSMNMAFEKHYPVLKAEVKKTDAKNPAPNNPGAIGAKFIALGKKGDYKGLQQIFVTKEKLKELSDMRIEGGAKKYTTRHLSRLMDNIDEIVKKNTPDGAKNEIAKFFLTDFSDDKMKILATPITVYISETEASVAVAKAGKNAFYFVSLLKIDGKWKIINTDDSPAFKVSKQLEFDYSKYIQRRFEESQTK